MGGLWQVVASAGRTPPHQRTPSPPPDVALSAGPPASVVAVATVASSSAAVRGGPMLAPRSGGASESGKSGRPRGASGGAQSVGSGEGTRSFLSDSHSWGILGVASGIGASVAPLRRPPPPRARVARLRSERLGLGARDVRARDGPPHHIAWRVMRRLHRSVPLCCACVGT